MKKIISTVLACVLLVCMLCTLCSCGKTLMGKYEADLSILGTYTYEFDAFGKVTRTIDPIIGDNKITEGKYEINEAGDKITFTFANDEGVEESETLSFATVVKNDVEYLEIGGVQYTKVK